MILSIIVPIYNVEPFIRGTLNSIYAQNVEEGLFEVIVVNDGSPDNSMSIVNEYVAIHSNLMIINQENQGLSCARNAGIKVATGNYIWFVDSDDRITEQSITEALVTIKTHHDVEIFCFDMNEERGHKLKEISLFSKKTYQKYYGQVNDGFFYCRKIPTGIVQRFLFLRSFLEEYSLLFTPKIYHEDQDFLYRCFMKAKRIMPLNKIWYNYNVRECGSITSTFNMKRFNDTLYIINSFRKQSKSVSEYKKIVILEEGVFTLSFGLLTSAYRNNSEYRMFLAENKNKLRYLLLSSYFKSLTKNSLGKSFRLIKGLII